MCVGRSYLHNLFLISGLPPKFCYALINSYALFILSLVTFAIHDVCGFYPSQDPYGRNGPKYKDMLMQPNLEKNNRSRSTILEKSDDVSNHSEPK